jgi:hypothetical protein
MDDLPLPQIEIAPVSQAKLRAADERAVAATRAFASFLAQLRSAGAAPAKLKRPLWHPALSSCEPVKARCRALTSSRRKRSGAEREKTRTTCGRRLHGLRGVRPGTARPEESQTAAPATRGAKDGTAAPAVRRRWRRADRRQFSALPRFRDYPSAPPAPRATDCRGTLALLSTYATPHRPISLASPLRPLPAQRRGSALSSSISAAQPASPLSRPFASPLHRFPWLALASPSSNRYNTAIALHKPNCESSSETWRAGQPGLEPGIAGFGDRCLSQLGHCPEGGNASHAGRRAAVGAFSR